MNMLDIILIIIGITCIVLSVSSLHAIKSSRFNATNLTSYKSDTRMVIKDGKLQSRK